MRYPAITLLLALIFVGCAKESDYDYTADEIFKSLEIDFSEDSIPADLGSTIVMTIKMPITSDTNLTKFNLSCSNGIFVESGTNKLTTNISHVFGDESHRYVEVTLEASNKVGSNTVTIVLAGYEKTESYKLYPAVATAVELSSTVDYIRNDSISEIPLSALVRSGSNFASRPVNVVFSADFDPPYPGPTGFFYTEEPVAINGSSIAGNIFVFQGDDSYIGDITFYAEVSSEIKDSIVVHVIN